MGERDFLSDDEDRRDFFTPLMDDVAEEFSAQPMDWGRTGSRPWDFLREIVPEGLTDAKLPDEVKNHFRAAQHEILLGVRSLLEDWINRTDVEAKPNREVLMKSRRP